MTTIIVRAEVPDAAILGLPGALEEFFKARGGRFIAVEDQEVAPELAAIGVTSRFRTLLAAGGITTKDELLSRTRASAQVRGIGQSRLRELVRELAKGCQALKGAPLEDQLELLIMSFAVYEALIDAGIDRISELIRLDVFDLIRLTTFRTKHASTKNVRKMWIAEIRSALRRRHLDLADRLDKRYILHLPTDPAFNCLVQPGGEVSSMPLRGLTVVALREALGRAASRPDAPEVDQAMRIIAEQLDILGIKLLQLA
jgi:hypothetical protein